MRKKIFSKFLYGSHEFYRSYEFYRFYESHSSYFLYKTFLAILLLHSCTMNVNVVQDSLEVVKIDESHIIATSSQSVQIEMSGLCIIPQEEIDVLSQNKGLKTQKSLDALQPDEFYLHCDENKKFTGVYIVPNPNKDRKIVFTFTNKKDPALRISEIIHYSRPPLVSPVITQVSNETKAYLADFRSLPYVRTRDMSVNHANIQSIHGTCDEVSASHLEMRFGLSPSVHTKDWERVEKEEFCQNKKWSWKPFQKNFWNLEESQVADGMYEFHLRFVNAHAHDAVSSSSVLKILIDRTPPKMKEGEQVYTITGVRTESQDQILDEWLGVGSVLEFQLSNMIQIHKWEFLLKNPKANSSSTSSSSQLGEESQEANSVLCRREMLTSEIVRNKRNIRLDSTAGCRLDLLSHNSQYEIEVFGFDSSGNKSQDSFNFVFTRDIKNVSLSWDQTPTNTTDNHAQFRFSISDVLSPVVSVLCSFNNQKWSACAPDVDIDLDHLKSGTYSYRVEAVDKAGNKTLLTHSWTVNLDKESPLCHFEVLDSWFATPSPTLAFKCVDNGFVRSVSCSLNNQKSWKPCTSFTEESLSQLQDGQHTLFVKARDNSGLESEVISQVFYVDTQKPLILITMQPAQPNNLSSNSVLFTTSDSLSGIAKIQCRLNEESYSDCHSLDLSVFPKNASGEFSVSQLVEGLQTVDIQVVDRVGNTHTHHLSWVVDYTPPGAPIFLVKGIEDGPRRPIWQWESGGGGTGLYEIKMDDNDFSVGAQSLSNTQYSPLEDLDFGEKTLWVRERDDAGNWSEASFKTFLIKCNPGEFFAGGKCYLCPEGTYNSVPSIESSCTPAETGRYVASEGSVKTTLCTNKPDHAVDVVYDESAGLSSNSCPIKRVTQCLEPDYIVDESKQNTLCRTKCGPGQHWFNLACVDVGPGYYSPSYHDSRYPCQAGYYGESSNHSVATCSGPCLAGYSCLAGSTNNQGDGTPCPLGYFCPTGSSTPQMCGDNEYTQETGSSSCQACPAHSGIKSSQATDHDSITDCASQGGYYNCHSGSCLESGFGYYSPVGDDQRYSCKAGSFGSSSKNTVEICDGSCSPGYFCPEGSVSGGGSGLCQDDSYSTGGATTVACTSCPQHSKTLSGGASTRDEIADCFGVEGYYNCQTGSCSVAGIGYYADKESNIRSQCPANSTTLTTTSHQISQCLGSSGYYQCESGVCSQATSSEYSPINSNQVYSCPENSFSGELPVEKALIADCKAGIDYYDHDNNPETAPILVGKGFYSIYRSNSRVACTNLPPQALSVTYSGSGSGQNNCPVDQVLVCSPGYEPSGQVCLDNEPASIQFTNQSNVEMEDLIESNEVIVTSFDGPRTATCTGCSAIARNGVWGGTTVTGFMPGDTIAIRLIASSDFSTSKIATVTLATTTSSNWVVGTRPPHKCLGTPWGTLNHLETRTGYANGTPAPPSACVSETRKCEDGVLSGSFTATTCHIGCLNTLWGDVLHGYSNTAYLALESSNCVGNSQTRSCNNGTFSGTYTHTSCIDDTPDPINFSHSSNQELGVTVSSSPVTVTGFDGPRTATCTGCSAIARNGVWGGTTVTGFMPGDTIAIKRVSSSSYSSSVSATVTLSKTTSNSWTVTTRAGYSCTGTSWGTLSHGSSVTAYSTSSALPPATCSTSSVSRQCWDGTLQGNSSFSHTSCNNGCSGTPWGIVSHGYSNTAYSSSTPAGSCSSFSQTRTCSNGSMNGSFTATSCTNGCTGTPWGSVSHGYSNTAYSTSTPAGSCSSSSFSEARTCSNGSMNGSFTATSCTNGCTGTPWGSVSHGYSNTAYSTSTPAGSCSSVSQTRTCSSGSMSGSFSITSCTNGCSATTVSNCSLSSAPHGGSSGSCASGYSGSCSYICASGSYGFGLNTCKRICYGTYGTISSPPNNAGQTNTCSFTWGNAVEGQTISPATATGGGYGSLYCNSTGTWNYNYVCPSPGNVASCPGGQEYVQSPINNAGQKNTCYFSWSQKLAGESVNLSGTNGGSASGTCLSTGQWNVSFICPAPGNLATCAGGTMGGIPSKTKPGVTCTLSWPQALAGQTVSGSGTNGGTISGTCLSTGQWSYTYNCP
jgi:hypothetical protein